MRALLLTIVLTLLPFTISAADLFETFSSCREFIRNELGYAGSSSGPLNDSTINQYLRVATVVNNPLIEGRTITLTSTTVVGKNSYVLDSSVKVIAVEIKRQDTIKSLFYVPRELWYEQTHKVTRGGMGFNSFPSYYDYTDSLLFIHPPPITGGDTITILAVERFPNIDTASSLARIPRKYRVVIVKYATYLIARAIQHPFVAAFKQDYEEAVMRLGNLFDVARIVREANATTP